MNKSVELQIMKKATSLTVLPSSSCSLTLRMQRIRIRRGTLWIPLLQTYLLTVGSIRTSSVHIACWANLRMLSRQRGALLLKALYRISMHSLNTSKQNRKNNNSSSNHLHLMAALSEIDCVITSNRSHFLLSSAHFLG